MKSERISPAVDKRGQPIEFTKLLWSSAQSPWSGFKLERHRLGPAGRLGEFVVQHTLLGMCLAGSAQMEVGSGKQAKRVVARPGRFTLLARGDQQKSIAWSGTRETLYVSVNTGQLERFWGQDITPKNFSVVSQHAIADPQVLRLLTNMHDEVQAGCPSGKIYGEALSLALANYLLARYSLTGAAKTRAGISFSAPQAARLQDYIRVHLRRDTTLTELADLVGLSPHYFSLLFKNTFGIAPHHYLLGERIHEGQKLLATRRLSVCEVALELGFSDQSHFTQVFRKVTGTTPKRFQRSC
jgi:AraC family transcriptional regulator